MNWIAEKPKTWDSSLAVILAHGAGQGMESPFMTFFHSGLARAGVLSVKFNFQYMDQGRKMPDRQPQLQQQYREVIDEVRRVHSPQKLIIGGKSMGGRVASYIAHDSAEVGGLIFLGYPLHAPGRPDRLRDVHLYEIDRPMLFISGTKDTLAQPHLLENVTRRIGARAALRWIEDGDHSLQVRRSGKTSWPEALSDIEAWLRQTGFR